MQSAQGSIGPKKFSTKFLYFLYVHPFPKVLLFISTCRFVSGEMLFPALLPLPQASGTPVQL